MIQALGETAILFEGLGLPRNLAVMGFTGYRDVPLAWLPSAIFRTPLLAVCTLWSWVRLRQLMCRSQKRTVTSKITPVTWKLFSFR